MSTYEDKLDAALSSEAELAANLSSSPGFEAGLRQIARTVATEAKAIGRIALDDATAAAAILAPIVIAAAEVAIKDLIASELNDIKGRLGG